MTRTGRRAIPLEQKLSLLFTGVIAFVLLASLVLTYTTLTRDAERQAAKRLASAVSQFAASASQSLVERRGLLRTAASDAAVIRLFESPGTEQARAALAAASVLRPGASGPATPPIELWRADGTRLAFVGRDLGAGDPTARVPVRRPGLETLASGDSVTFGRIHVDGDEVFFWAAAPVQRDGRTLGFVAQQLRVMGPPTATQYMRDVTGEEVRLIVHDERTWIVAPGTVTTPRTPRRAVAGVPMRDAPDGPVLAAEARIDGTWMAMLEAPLASVHARSRGVLATIAGVGGLLMVLGALLSWLIGRRIARPVGALTDAAEAIAQGDYTRRVPFDGGDEIGRLSVSFNRMATEVEASRTQLEQRVDEAQASAHKLEYSNLRLQTAMTAAERAREEAQQANRAKSDFLAVMSHELRTPLNAIGGYAQLLDLEVHGPITSAQRDAIARITRSQGHLLRLIDDVLNFARVDAGQMRYTMRDVPLDDTLGGIEMLVAPQLRTKGLSFTYRQCDADVRVHADEDKLRQVVLNLLTNAIKFTPEGGRIEVECECEPESVRIRVRDSGVGIPAERLGAIFDPFVQLDRPAGGAEGVGLGLAISRELARGMGGDLEVESTVGVGSTFSLTLRTHDAAARPRALQKA